MGETAQQPGFKFNGHVEMLLAFCSGMQIDELFGLQEFANYMREVALLDLGIPYAELGIGERRQKTRPTMYAPAFDACGAVIGGKYVVSGDSLYSEADTRPGSIAITKIRGVMQVTGGASGYGMEDYAEDMRAAASNPNIDAVVTYFRSGGGMSQAGDIARGVIEEVKEVKPVIAYIEEAGSAAYNAASVANEIIASGKTARVGSIGTYLTIDKQFLETIRNRFLNIYADTSPDKNKEIRAAEIGDYSLLKAYVNKMNDEFMQGIKSARPLTGDRLQIQQTLQGGMFDGLEGKERGLIDSFGNMAFAMQRAAMWAKKRKQSK